MRTVKDKKNLWAVMSVNNDGIARLCLISRPGRIEHRNSLYVRESTLSDSVKDYRDLSVSGEIDTANDKRRRIAEYKKALEIYYATPNLPFEDMPSREDFGLGFEESMAILKSFAK